MIFPYVMVYGLPVAYLVALAYSPKGLDMARVRRFFLTQMALTTAAFAIYLAFPVRSDYLFNEETGKHEYREDTWAGRLCFQFVHQGISLYVACPSMHTAHAFSVAWAFARDKIAGTSFAISLAIVTLFSTCMTKAHHPPHLAMGLLLCYFIQRSVFDPLTSRLP